MPKKFKQTKNKKYIFVIQIIDDYLKIIKIRPGINKNGFIDFEFTRLEEGINDKELVGKTKPLLEKLSYNNNQIILSLPRQQATCRYIKIPARFPAEIDKIIPFQAAKYLPYPPQELISGYQIVLIDKEGYSYINLNIVHKDIISGYISFFDSLNIKNFSIILNSYGLNNLYSEIEPPKPEINMIIDIDYSYAELIVARQGKLFFSRSFKLPPQDNLENILSEEINKTNSVYAKETGQLPAGRVIIFTNKNISAQNLSAKISLPVQTFDYREKDFLRQSGEKIKASGLSVAGLVGLGLKQTEAELNILPPQAKEARLRISRKKEFIKVSAAAVISVVMLTFAVAKDLGNKKYYSDMIKAELSKISKEAKILDELEKRFDILESQAKSRLIVLDALHELHRTIPQEVYLNSFVYEEDKQIVLRGQAPNLDSVFRLVSEFEKSKVSDNFMPKLRYATKKKTQTKDIVDFEIICLQKQKE